MRRVRFRPPATLFVLSLALGSACGAAKEKSGESAGVSTVPRPDQGSTGAGGASAGTKPAICEDQEDCRGSASCVGTCGVHQLADMNCSCHDGVLACTDCVYAPSLQGVAQDATAFCADTFFDGDPCTTKGETCIMVDAERQTRSSCLCWKAKQGLAWSCDERPTTGFFKDLAPPTPPAPDGGVPSRPLPGR
jgi:hypothetical protein